MKPLLHCCGIYEIRNLIAGTRYIGSSVHLGRRLNDHKYLLRRGKHHCIRLQRAWDRDGEANFQFSILVVLEPREQLFTEQRFLDGLRAGGEDLYNMALSATSPNLGRKASPETKAKLSADRRSRFSDPAARERIAATLRDKLSDPFVRAEMSARRRAENQRPEVIKKKSDAMKARYQRPGEREKTSTAGRGRVFSEATREKLSASTSISSNTPEARAARSERMKARWADPVSREIMLAAMRKR